MKEQETVLENDVYNYNGCSFVFGMKISWPWHQKFEILWNYNNNKVTK